MVNYKNKYLKYKLKYLNLQNPTKSESKLQSKPQSEPISDNRSTDLCKTLHNNVQACSSNPGCRMSCRPKDLKKNTPQKCYKYNDQPDNEMIKQCNLNSRCDISCNAKKKTLDKWKDKKDVYQGPFNKPDTQPREEPKLELTVESLKKYTVPELREQLIQQELSPFGKKDELISRLNNNNKQTNIEPVKEERSLVNDLSDFIDSYFSELDDNRKHKHYHLTKDKKDIHKHEHAHRSPKKLLSHAHDHNKTRKRKNTKKKTNKNRKKSLKKLPTDLDVFSQSFDLDIVNQHNEHIHPHIDTRHKTVGFHEHKHNTQTKDHYHED